jgi:hypothetical protein
MRKKEIEAIAEIMKKEPWDDDDDDESLFKAHDMLMPDPVKKHQVVARPPPVPAPFVTPAPPVAPTPLKSPVQKYTTDFIRTHGPINKAIEVVLNKLPGLPIEFLSQDMSLNVQEWDAPQGLLYKLNPIGVPPHRLRVKVGCIVSLLRDLNTISQLPRSQHLRVLRCENDRLECLVLDGQLEERKTFLIRVPFRAKYRDSDQHPFQRTQFPIRVIDCSLCSLPRETPQTGLKLPTIPGRVPPTHLPRKPAPPVAKAKPQANNNSSFELSGLPTLKSCSFLPSKSPPISIPTPPMTPFVTDRWDDFLESGTQIARDLDTEMDPHATHRSQRTIAAHVVIGEDLPPMSIQDLNFSINDPDHKTEPQHKLKALHPSSPQPAQTMAKKLTPPLQANAVAPRPAQSSSEVVPSLPPMDLDLPRPQQHLVKTATTQPPAQSPIAPKQHKSVVTPVRAPPRFNTRRFDRTLKIAGRCLKPGPFATGLEAELAKLGNSQLPKSMNGLGPTHERKKRQRRAR